MAIFVIGGTGFIGTRVIRLLAARGEEIVCMDINPGAASFEDLGKQVRVLRGDVTQFDDVMAATVSAKPEPDHQPVVFPRQRACPARGDEAQHPGHGQLLRGGAPGRRSACGVRQFAGGERHAEALRRSHDHRGRLPPRRSAVRDAQDLQRVAGAGLQREIRHDDHRDPAGQRDRAGQGARFGRPCEHHHPAGAGQADLVPLQGRDALPDPCR